MLKKIFGRHRRFDRERGAAPNSTNPVIALKKEKIPLAVELVRHPDSINTQQSSPLFGKLPTELRELIWRFALTRYQDNENPYPLTKRYARPGQAAPLCVAVGLLLTCRAVYIEAFLVPFQVNPILVFDGDYLDRPPLGPLVCTPSWLLSCDLLKPWQLANISSVEMTVQQFTLEGGAVERVSRTVGAKDRHTGCECQGFAPVPGIYASFVKPGASHSVANKLFDETVPSPLRNIFVGKKITHLTIRMSRTDWWMSLTSPAKGETDLTERLRLEPMVDTTLPKFNSMLWGYRARKEGKTPDFRLDSFERLIPWGTQFAEYWPDLQTLDLVLETFVQKQGQLDFVVECARLWTFPLGDDQYRLEWDGKEAPAVKWQGASTYGYERGFSWLTEQNNEQGNGRKDPAMARWTPVDETADDGQQFIIRTLTFERRKTESHATSLKPRFDFAV
ncbi:hypothetical protein F4779DRAFT_562207 [Xylariaceae sp. FL0662B]|nr:hypothetical protein F4779DRAFT_562207 [Xylariaceae sp. FL0662B]